MNLPGFRHHVKKGFLKTSNFYYLEATHTRFRSKRFEINEIVTSDNVELQIPSCLISLLQSLQ